jgi:hypothetical protein
VVAPPQPENAQFGDVRIAADNFLNARRFFTGKAMFRGDGGSYFDFGFDHWFGLCHQFPEGLST